MSRTILTTLICCMIGAGVLNASPVVIPSNTSSAVIEVAFPTKQTVQEQAALQVLTEESAKRGRVTWSSRTGRLNLDHCKPYVVLVAQRDQVEEVLPQSLVVPWRYHLLRLHPSSAAEAFSIVTLPWKNKTKTGIVEVISGNDPRGELFGVGWLLRHMSFEGGIVQLPPAPELFSAPDKPIRGHQIGYRFKNNTYDAWTLGQFEQHIRDLAIFGTNTLQLISPVSDDDPLSPLMPAPPLETFLGISRLLDKYGLRCDLYYPEMRKDYADPAQFQAELKDFEALVRKMPRVDSVHIPGGDPGHTPPAVLFPLVAAEARIIRKYQPSAAVWISAQGFDAQQYESFYRLLGSGQEWLTGVFFGPQSRDGMEIQRRQIPARYSMEFYPDIAHVMHAQFPVPQWDPVFALTEGREPICPRPMAFSRIYKDFQDLNSGFITYSEGVNDDVNKILWSQLGWMRDTQIDTILGEYARWFLHREGEQEGQAVALIKGLEHDWDGPLLENKQIAKTFELTRHLEDKSNRAQSQGNWQWESVLYRSYYDMYLQRNFAREQSAQHEAEHALISGGTSASRVKMAERSLNESKPGAEEQREHDELFQLGGKLYNDIGLQLSVKLYGASNWERGANLDRVDTPLNDRVWMRAAMAKAEAQPTETAKINAIEAIANWQMPVPGAMYDDLGSPAHEAHLIRGDGWQRDPEMYHTAIDGIADRTLEDGWRLSWLSYAEALYEEPLDLEYRGLDRSKNYRVRLTYAGEDYTVPLTLTAGDVVIHSSRLRRSNPETYEFELPKEAIVNGTLHLRWMRGTPGGGGGGRGRQLAEVWLLPQPAAIAAKGD